MADAEEEQLLTGGEKCKLFCKFCWRGVIVVIAPIILLPILFITKEDVLAYRCMYTVLLMTIYWVTEALPLPITSMIPIVLFPCFGILGTEATTMAYFKETNVMFLAGLILALAIEFCNLHKRIALKVVSCIGCSQRKLSFGLMLVTMFISMWISNTAASAMMCPIIVALIQELERQGMGKMYVDLAVDVEKDPNADPPNPSKSTICYFMGIAYAATIGGIGSLIGSGVNLTFKGIYESRFPEAPGIDFPKFTFYNTPIMLICTLLTWLYLQIVYAGMFRPNSEAAHASSHDIDAEKLARELITKRYHELGKMTAHEVFVAISFCLSIALFFLRDPGIFEGWASWIAPKTKIKDATPGIFIVLILFMIPATWVCFKFCRRNLTKSDLPKKPATGLLTWAFVHANVPWSLLFLLGGGFAIAEGSTKSGMSILLGNGLSGLKVLPPLAILFIVCLINEMLTELTANVAITNITLPVLAELAVVVRIHPMYLMLPATLAASFAFHLPVGTPPNAIVAGYANIRTKDMAIAGLGPTLVTLIVIWAAFPTWGALIYPGTHIFPKWAEPKNKTVSKMLNIMKLV